MVCHFYYFFLNNFSCIDWNVWTWCSWKSAMIPNFAAAKICDIPNCTRDNKMMITQKRLKLVYHNPAHLRTRRRKIQCYIHIHTTLSLDIQKYTIKLRNMKKAEWFICCVKYSWTRDKPMSPYSFRHYSLITEQYKRTKNAIKLGTLTIIATLTSNI